MPKRDEAQRLEAVASAPVSVFGQGSASLPQAYTLRPVTEGNCVLVRGGGEQLEVKEQSVG